MDLQRLRNEGSLADANARTGAGLRRKVTNRFTFKTANGGEPTGYADVTRIEVAGSNRVYEINGDRYNVVGFQEDPKNPTAKPNEAAYKELNKAILTGDEETMNNFADHFHFLPAYAVRNLPKFLEGPVTGESTSTSSSFSDSE
jgi:hypothetical protein